jgi:hypothetical protein
MTDLYAAMNAAEAAFAADDTIANLRALEAAEQAYFAYLKVARSQWNALPEGDRKDSAEQNANDTRDVDQAFEPGNELAWFHVALGSYDMLDA